jgi:hypothetical protein
MVSKSKSMRLLAMTLALLAAQAAHSASRWDKPAIDLADRIAEILGPGQALISVTNRSTVPTTEIPLIRRLFEDELRAHGVQPSGAESANQIRITLSETARQRLWVAEIVEGSQTRYAMVPFDREAGQSEARESAMLLTRKLLIRSASPVLAALETPSALVLLEPEAIVIDAKTATGSQEAKRVSLGRRPFQSRDPRGLLIPSPDGFTAYAPGAQCEGKFAAASDSQTGDWTVACHESDDPWPILASNLAAQPANLRAFYNPGRNFYTGVLAPSLNDNVPPFYSIAPLPGPRLIIGGIDGKVQMLDGSSLKPVTGTRDWGSDFAAIRTGCGSGAQMIATSSGEALTDSLRAYELSGQEAVVASAPLELDGSVTALWTAPDGASALAVIRKSPTEYEVARVSALCP